MPKGITDAKNRKSYNGLRYTLPVSSIKISRVSGADHTRYDAGLRSSGVGMLGYIDEVTPFLLPLLALSRKIFSAVQYHRDWTAVGLA